MKVTITLERSEHFCRFHKLPELIVTIEGVQIHDQLTFDHRGRVRVDDAIPLGLQYGDHTWYYGTEKFSDVTFTLDPA